VNFGTLNSEKILHQAYRFAHLDHLLAVVTVSLYHAKSKNSFSTLFIYDSDCLRYLRIKLECGPMPNVMAALPNTGGALCSTPQSLADAHYLNAVQ